MRIGYLQRLTTVASKIIVSLTIISLSFMLGFSTPQAFAST
jgi:hypothetical protein